MARQQKKRAEKAKPEQKICRQERDADRLGKNEKQGDLFTRRRDLQNAVLAGNAPPIHPFFSGSFIQG
jgi:hypothetical protein